MHCECNICRQVPQPARGPQAAETARAGDVQPTEGRAHPQQRRGEEPRQLELGDCILDVARLTDRRPIVSPLRPYCSGSPQERSADFTAPASLAFCALVPTEDKAPTLHRLRPTEESRARPGHSGQLQLFASAHWRLMAGATSAPGLRAPLSHLRQDCRWGLALTGMGANSAGGERGVLRRHHIPSVVSVRCRHTSPKVPRPLLRVPDSMLEPGPRLWPVSIIAPVSLPPGPGPFKTRVLLY